MRRILLLFVTVFSFVVNKAQIIESEAIIVRNLVSGNKDLIGFSSEYIGDYIISSTYENTGSGYRMVYLQQAFRGIPVYNQMLVLAFRNGKLVSKAGSFLPGFEKFVNVKSGVPPFTPESAMKEAISNRGLPATNRTATVIKKSNAGDFAEFSDMGVSRENITAQLIWAPIENSQKFHLAWQVYIIPKTSSDFWMVRVDAVNSKVIGVDNYTNYDHWDHSETGGGTSKHVEISVQSKSNYNCLFYFNDNNKYAAAVTTAIYRVVPFPAEAPSFSNGAHALRTDPWLAAPGNATSLKWNTGIGGIDYDYTRGNNVWAYQDTANNNTGTVAKSAISTTILPNLTFDFMPDYAVDPKQNTPVQNQQFNITNLFYWNNIIHDIMYQYGFTETSGNFQEDNQGRGGLGNDYVKAEAQDGGGVNNANFSTPVDGTSGRMQMYLWNGGTPLKDGDVDNGIIVHEYGHGISNRLTGGPGNSSCLQNAEQMGEGWSDYYSLMFTQDWASATLTTGFNSPRGIGTYAKFQAPTGPGIRTQKYCADFSINNRVYSTNLSTSAHNRGEIWCATLWDMTWNIINQIGGAGAINPNLYDVAGGGGNTIAMKLVTEGLRLQQCSPGFISGRNAILQADQNLYGGAYSCSIWEAFRRRGMGVGATEGSTSSISDQVPDFNLYTFGAVPSVTSIMEASNIVYTHTVSTNACSGISNYTLRDTLPSNVTYVGGGIYDALNRVVSFPVTQAAGSTNNYIFTVNVNNGSYFTPVTLFNETVSGVTIPADWTVTTPSGTPWTVFTTISNSSPNSFYVNNLATAADQRLATTVSYALPQNSYPELSFWHKFNTESGWDGGVLEVSTNGGTNWTDLGSQITLNGYNGGLGAAPTNALSGRAAFTGLQNTFINTRINLTSFAGMSVMLRFRFGSDDNTTAPTSPAGWWVDDILLNYSAGVVMRSNLFNPSSSRVSLKDMVTLITPLAPTVNDDAPGAILLTVGAGCSGSPYTNAGAMQSGSEPFAACVGTAGYKTVWYKFIAPASGAVRISNDYSGGTMASDSRVSLFSATDVNNYATFTNIACDDNNGITVGDRSVLYANGLTPGGTYYFQVDGKMISSVTGTFCLTVDELTSSMISTATACAAGQSLTAVNDNYAGWLSATDANGNLVAMISNPSGGATTSTYTHNLNVNAGPVRTDAVSGQKYLDRNFSIDNASVSNLNVRFWMKNTEVTILQVADPEVTLSNLQVTRQTGVTCDNDFTAANGTNSSLAQTGNGTGTGYSWVQVNTPGLSKFYLHTNKSYLPVRTFLQGAYSGTQHKAVTTTWAGILNANALSQPYSGVPFSYTGTESVSSGFFTSGVSTTEVMEWVLLELRDAVTPATVIARRAAFIREDGRIVDLDGVSEVSFRNIVPGNYHLVIRHRNHLAIRTATVRTLNGRLGVVAPALYDFSTGQSQAFQDGAITSNSAMKDLGGGVFGMWGGNANGMTTGTNAVNQVKANAPNPSNDFFFLFNTSLGGNIITVLSNVYHAADVNMDGLVKMIAPNNTNDFFFLFNTVLIGNSATIINQHQ